jgi:hypothetical protein
MQFSAPDMENQELKEIEVAHSMVRLAKSLQFLLRTIRPKFKAAQPPKMVTSSQFGRNQSVCRLSCALCARRPALAITD